MIVETNKIICGDNVATMADMPKECVDLVVTSPPYDSLREYNGFSWDFESVAAGLKRVLKPGGVIVWVVSDQTKDGSESGSSFRQALHFMGLGLNLHDTMIFQKKGVGACGSNLAYWQQWEFMFVFSKGRPASINRIADVKNSTYGQHFKQSQKCESIGTRKRPERGVTVSEYGIRTNVWQYDTGMLTADDTTAHPAPFPEALAADHIISWSNPGDIVLDPFNGSGTTTKMARQLGRQFVGIEISEEYCQIARKRIAQELLFS